MASIELPALYVDNVALVTASGRLLVVNRDPSPGEENVSLDTAIALELLDPGADGVDRVATRIYIDDKLAFSGGVVPEVSAEFAGPRSYVAETADTLRVVLDPVQPLESRAIVSVRILSRTVGGAGELDEFYSFTIEDRTAPQVVGAQALAPKLVRIGFDEPVMVADDSGVEFNARSAPAVPLTAIRINAQGTVLTVTLDTEMTPGAEYGLEVVGVADLSGNPVLAPFERAVFRGFRPARPPGRQFDLWRMLPKHNRRDDQTQDLFKFVACLQEVTDLLLAESDRWPDIFDFERAPEPFLDLILEDLGNPFAFDLDVLQKRRLASVLVSMYRQKGTAVGIRNAVRFFLGIEVLAITAFNVESLTLGEALLGVDWVLGASTSFARYAFSVEVGRILTQGERRELRAIVEYLKPPHTHFVDLIEPAEPEAIDDWELGISELGANTDLH